MVTSSEIIGFSIILDKDNLKKEKERKKKRDMDNLGNDVGEGMNDTIN